MFQSHILYTTQDVYKKLKIINVLILLDGITADMVSNRKINQIATELFIRSRQLNISLDLLHKLILLYQKIVD